MEQLLMTLHQFLLSWLTDEKFREDNPDLKQAMEDRGLGEVSGEDVHEAMRLVSDELPPYQAQQMGPYLNAPSGAYNQGNFNITQGGSAGAAGSGAQAASGYGINESYGGGTGHYTAPTHQGDGPLDDAVREIQYITNNITNITETNTTNIDDRDTAIDNSVRQNIDTDGGDLDQQFVSSNVSGDVTGDGNAVGLGNTALSGGDGAIVGSEIGSGANVVTGDVGGNFAGRDNFGSNIGGDNHGQVVGDATNANVIGGDSGVAAAGGGDVEGVKNLNVGDGTQEIDDSTEIRDSFNTETKDSFNTVDSFNDAKDSFNDANDSFNQIDQSIDAPLVADDVDVEPPVF
jgi:hypothetical protein